MSIELHERPTKYKVELVDVVLDVCKWSFGSAPCAAAIGSGGVTARCYNTYSTCPAKASYSQLYGGRTYRFARADGPLLPGVEAHRIIESITPVPGSGIDEAAGLGGIGKVTIKLRDFLDTVDVPDPYRTLREVREGPFLAKLEARNAYYQGRPVLVYTGFLDPDGTLNIGGMRIQRYVLEDIKFGAKGEVTITAKEPQKLLDRAMLPVPTSAELAADMTAGDLSFTLRSGHSITETADFWVKIDDEIMKVGARTGDACTGLTRQYTGTGTVAAAHDADTKVQVGYVGEGVRIDAAVVAALTSSGIDPSLIDSATFATTVARWLTNHYYTWFYFDPKPAMKRVVDFLRAGSAFGFWDSEAQVFRFDVMHPRTPDQDVSTFTATGNLTSRPVEVTRLQERQKTRCLILYALRDWSKDPEAEETQANEYQRIQGHLDLGAESANARNAVLPEVIIAPFCPATMQAELQSMAFRFVNRNVIPPRSVKFGLEARDGHELRPGTLVEIECPELIDESGAQVATECLIAQKTPAKDGGCEHEVRAETTGLEDLWAFYNDNSGVPAFSTATAEQRRKAFYATAAGFNTDGSKPYRYI